MATRIRHFAKDIIDEYGHYGFELTLGEPDVAVVSSEGEEVAETQSKPQKRPAPEGLSDYAAKIYALLDGDIITVERISEKADCDIAQILSALTELEIWGVIQTLPGRRIQIC